MSQKRSRLPRGSGQNMRFSHSSLPNGCQKKIQQKKFLNYFVENIPKKLSSTLSHEVTVKIVIGEYSH